MILTSYKLVQSLILGLALTITIGLSACSSIAVNSTQASASFQNTFSKPAPVPKYYLVENQQVTLGKQQDFGEIVQQTQVSGDLNQDGLSDLAVILKVNSQGSGVFYYLNVFIQNTKQQLEPITELFLGDRIRIDFIDIYQQGSVSKLTGIPIHSKDYGQLVIAYFHHAIDQPFAQTPKLYLTKHWRLVDHKLILQEQN